MTRLFIFMLILSGVYLPALCQSSAPCLRVTGDAQLRATTTPAQMEQVRNELIYIDTRLPDALNQHRQAAAQQKAKTTDAFSLTDIHRVHIGTDHIDTARGAGNDRNVVIWIQLLRAMNTKLEKEEAYAIIR